MTDLLLGASRIFLLYKALQFVLHCFTKYTRSNFLIFTFILSILMQATCILLYKRAKIFLYTMKVKMIIIL